MSIEVMGGGGGVELPSWRYITISKEMDWRGICYADGYFVAMGTYVDSSSGNTYCAIWRSRHGVSDWTQISNGLSIGNPYKIYYIFGKYVITDYSSYLWVSLDAKTWSKSGPYNISFTDIEYGNGYAFAIDSSAVSTGGYYSSDLTNWYKSNFSSVMSAAAVVAFGKDMFVAVDRGTNLSAYSKNGGATWTAGANLPYTRDWSRICYNMDYFEVLAYNSTNAAYSYTPESQWFSTSSPKTDTGIAQFGDMIYGDRKIVTVDMRGGSISYKYYGDFWKRCPNVLYNAPNNPTRRPIAYGNGTFIALSPLETDKNKIFYLIDYFKEWDI